MMPITGLMLLMRASVVGGVEGSQKKAAAPRQGAAAIMSDWIDQWTSAQTRRFTA